MPLNVAVLADAESIDLYIKNILMEMDVDA